jgi:xanthine/uracil permease
VTRALLDVEEERFRELSSECAFTYRFDAVENYALGALLFAGCYFHLFWFSLLFVLLRGLFPPVILPVAIIRE